MKRLINLLGVVLALQLVLALFLGMTTPGVEGVTKSEPLLNFTAAAVDRITIEQPNKTPLVVERRENNWSIPALDGFPAFTSKVEGFLDRLAGLRKRIPISTTAIAVRRFKVSPAIYEHKVVLNSGEKILATLWLGDSPGLRQVHGRANEEDAVYNLDFAVYEVSSDPNQWADKMALNLKSDEITQITLPDVNLVRVKDENKADAPDAKNSKDGDMPGKWQVANLASGEELNSEEIETLVNRLANLSFDSVLGKENQAKYRQDTPILTLSVTTKIGEPRSYVFSVLEKETKPEKTTDAKNEKESEKVTVYILKTSTLPYYFKMADFMVKELLETKRSKLIKTVVTPPDAASKPDQTTIPQAPEPTAVQSESPPSSAQEIIKESIPAETSPPSSP